VAQKRAALLQLDPLLTASYRLHKVSVGMHIYIVRIPNFLLLF